jgi:hypothetical protein
MYTLRIILGIFILASVITGCGPKKSTAWNWCEENPPVASLVDYKNGMYEVIRCDLPKAESVTRVGKEYLWKMPSGSSCLYGRGPEVNRSSDKKITAMYGLRYIKKQRQDFYCQYDIGFMPVKEDDIGVLGFRSYTDKVSSTKSNTNLTVKTYLTEFKDGQIYANSIIFQPRNHNELRFKVLLRKKDGTVVKKWNYVEPQTYSYSYLDDKGKIQTVNHSNFLFELGNNIAFINNEAKASEFRTDYLPDNYKEIRTEFMSVNSSALHIPYKKMAPSAQVIHNLASQHEKLRNKQVLHIVNGKSASVVKSLSGNRYKVQPMADGDKTHWNIIAPLKGTNGLYGFIQADGSFKAPPGTLGVKPAIINSRTSDSKDIFAEPRSTRGVTEIEQPVAQFWLVAYDNKKGGYTWGKASADFSVISGPVWSSIKQHKIEHYKYGWLFARNIKNSRWISLDDFKLPLNKTTFSSPKEGMKHIQKTMQDIVAVRENNRRKEMKERSRLSDIAHEKAWKSYLQAKRSGNAQAIRAAAKSDASAWKDFLLSGYGTAAELERYINSTSWPGSAEKKMQAMLDNKRNAEIARLEQQRQQAALYAEKQKELKRLQYYANKRKDLEKWRNTVSSNIKRTNNTVQQQWGKHQTEMYKKGYISLPK